MSVTRIKQSSTDSGATDDLSLEERIQKLEESLRLKSATVEWYERKFREQLPIHYRLGETARQREDRWGFEAKISLLEESYEVLEAD